MPNHKLLSLSVIVIVEDLIVLSSRPSPYRLIVKTFRTDVSTEVHTGIHKDVCKDVRTDSARMYRMDVCLAQDRVKFGALSLLDRPAHPPL